MERAAQYERIATLLNTAIRNRGLYPEGSPVLRGTAEELTRAAGEILTTRPRASVGVLREHLIADGETLLPSTPGTEALRSRLVQARLDFLTFDRGVTPQEVDALVGFFGGELAPQEMSAADIRRWFAERGVRHITLRRVRVTETAGGAPQVRALYDEGLDLLRHALPALAQGSGSELPALEQLAMNLVRYLRDASLPLQTLLVRRAAEDSLYVNAINVAVLAAGVADSLGVPPKMLAQIALAGLCHDVGVLAMPENVLAEGESPEQSEAYARHTVLGGRALLGVGDKYPMLPAVALQHHCRADGAESSDVNPGVPGLGARLVGIVDRFDRVRADCFTENQDGAEVALQQLAGPLAENFDPDLLARFSALLGLYTPGGFVRLSSGEIAAVTLANPADGLRPRVRLLLDREERALEASARVELDLWRERGRRVAFRVPEQLGEHDLRALVPS